MMERTLRKQDITAFVDPKNHKSFIKSQANFLLGMCDQLGKSMVLCNLFPAQLQFCLWLN